MAPELIGESQGPVHDPILRQHDGIIQRTSADQSHRPQWFDIALKAECLGPRKHAPERFRVYHQFHFLWPNLRMRKIHVATNAKFVGWKDPDSTAILQHLHRLRSEERRVRK